MCHLSSNSKIKVDNGQHNSITEHIFMNPPYNAGHLSFTID